MKKARITLLAASLLALTLSTAITHAQENKPIATDMVATSTILIKGNWDQFNHAQIEKLIRTYGKQSANYSAQKPPYVVFDWDNTSVFLDIQEALMIYQMEHLRYAMTPKQLEVALHMNISDTNFSSEYNNSEGQAVNIKTISTDIVNSYQWLYDHYEGFKGKQSLAEVQKTDYYKDFTTKMRYLYEAIGDTFDHSVSYPWATYHFTGLTEADVRTLSAETLAWQENQPVEAVTWTSPESMKGQAGVVSITWKNGVKTVPEMQDLYHQFRDAGFDVYVCSASFVDVIKEVSSNPAFKYNNSDKNVIAMELERDQNGIIQTEFRKGYAQTQGKGKTEAIERFLVSKYGYGPIFVAGDSEGDQNMMQDFKDTQLVLIINRLRGNDIGQLSAIAVDSYGKPEAKYLLQGRDENTGHFLPSQKQIPLGKSEGQLLKKAK